MVSLIFSIIFFGLAFSLLNLQKILKSYSLKEAKYLANQGDDLAKKVQKIIAYKESYNLAIVVLTIIFLILALTFSKQLPLYLFMLVNLVYLFIVFLFNKKYKKTQKFLLTIFSPILSFVLNYLHQPLKKTAQYLHLNQDQTPLVFDSSDLIKFIEHQSKKKESRLDRDDLEFTKTALKLSETKVKELCLKWSKVKKLGSDQKIGPILLDELYKKKQSYVPVISQDKEVIGVLNVNNLNLDRSDKIIDHISTKINFIDEEDTISDLLLAINKTGSEVFVVVDYASKYSGIISYLDILNLFKLKDIDNSQSPPFN